MSIKPVGGGRYSVSSPFEALEDIEMEQIKALYGQADTLEANADYNAAEGLYREILKKTQGLHEQVFKRARLDKTTCITATQKALERCLQKQREKEQKGIDHIAQNIAAALEEKAHAAIERLTDFSHRAHRLEFNTEDYDGAIELYRAAKEGEIERCGGKETKFSLSMQQCIERCLQKQKEKEQTEYSKFQGLVTLVKESQDFFDSRSRDNCQLQKIEHSLQQFKAYFTATRVDTETLERATQMIQATQFQIDQKKESIEVHQVFAEKEQEEARKITAVQSLYKQAKELEKQSNYTRAMEIYQEALNEVGHFRIMFHEEGTIEKWEAALRAGMERCRQYRNRKQAQQTLTEACRSQDIQAVRQALHAKKRPDAQTLTWAVLLKDIGLVEKIIKVGAKPDEETLAAAISTRLYPLIHRVIELGVKANANAMELARRSGDTWIIETISKLSPSRRQSVAETRNANPGMAQGAHQQKVDQLFKAVMEQQRVVQSTYTEIAYAIGPSMLREAQERQRQESAKLAELNMALFRAQQEKSRF